MRYTKKEKYTIKDSFIRIRNIWVNYAMITVMFIIVDLLFEKIDFDFPKIILNLMVLDFSYNKFRYVIEFLKGLDGKVSCWLLSLLRWQLHVLRCY